MESLIEEDLKETFEILIDAFIKSDNDNISILVESLFKQMKQVNVALGSVSKSFIMNRMLKKKKTKESSLKI